MKFGCAVREIFVRTDRQTDAHRHAHRSIIHPCWGLVDWMIITSISVNFTCKCASNRFTVVIFFLLFRQCVLHTHTDVDISQSDGNKILQFVNSKTPNTHASRCFLVAEMGVVYGRRGVFR